MPLQFYDKVKLLFKRWEATHQIDETAILRCLIHKVVQQQGNTQGIIIKCANNRALISAYKSLPSYLNSNRNNMLHM